MKLCWPLGLMLLLLMSPVLIAQDDKKEDSKQEDATVAEQFSEAASDYAKIDRETTRKVRSAEDREEREAIVKEAEEAKAELIAKITKLAEEADNDKDAVTILVWLSGNGEESAQNAATMKILTDYVESEEIADFARNVGRKPGPRTEKILRKLIEKNPHDQVKGYATMSLAFMLSGVNRGNDLQGRQRDRFIESLGDGGEEFMEKWTKEAVDEEVISLFESIVENYADVSAGRGTLGDIAEGRLFTLKYLQIGKVAPDIEGADLDEVEFKLSDYRGKVVVLDFWGDW